MEPGGEAETLIPHKVRSLLVNNSRQWVDFIVNMRLPAVSYKGSGPNQELVTLNSHQAPYIQLQKSLDPRCLYDSCNSGGGGSAPQRMVCSFGQFVLSVPPHRVGTANVLVWRQDGILKRVL